MEKNVSYELFKYLSSIDMEISVAEYAHLDTAWCAEGIASPFTRIYMILSGKAYIKDKFEEIEMTSGNVYIIPAYHEFSYRCEDEAEKVYFHISMPMPGKFDAMAVVDKFVVIKKEQGYVERTEGLVKNRDIKAAFELKSMLYEIAAICIKSHNSSVQPIVYSRLIMRAFEYIDRNLSVSLQVEEVADALFVSPSKLQKLFKKEVGMSVGKYVDNCLMLYAEKELRCGNKSISEISEKLGFCDRFYFSRLFSASYGLPPARYRKQVRINGV